jgi:hypothetical protein
MSLRLRRTRKRRSLPRRLLALWASWQLRRPMKIAACVLALAAAVRAVRRRRAGRDLPDYGPPNESVPSHETLAPAQEASGQTA